MTDDANRELVRAAIDGEPAAARELVRRLTPTVHHRVSRACAQHGRVQGRALERAQVLDLVQDVLLLLFDDDAAVLRSWSPTGGLSLQNFVGLVAAREAASILRSGRRSAWAETPSSSDLLELRSDEAAFEHGLDSRDELTRIWRRLEASLSPRGLALFDALLVEERPIHEVSAAFSMSSNALYAFRSRVRQRLQEIRKLLSNDDSGTYAGSEPAREVSRHGL